MDKTSAGTVVFIFKSAVFGKIPYGAFLQEKEGHLLENKKQGRTLYVSDLDGTLLNRRSQISPQSLTILNSLIERGVSFTYATARSLSSARIAAQGLHLRLPVAVYNGAFLIDAATGRIQHACTFTLKERMQAQVLFQAYKVHPFVYTFLEGQERVLWHSGTENPGMKRYLDSRPGDPRFLPVSSSEKIYQGEIFYYTCIGSRSELEGLAHAFEQDKRYTCLFQREIYTEDEYWLEIMPQAATKANAILRLKELFGFEKIVSFGDAVNDLPMFRISDEAYAVENAAPALKQEATDIIADNENDGVALWLLHQIEDSV